MIEDIKSLAGQAFRGNHSQMIITRIKIERSEIES
jgi:hypothetical protein